MIDLLHKLFGEMAEGQRGDVKMSDIWTACRKADRPRMFVRKKKQDLTQVLAVGVDKTQAEDSGYTVKVRNIVDTQRGATEEELIEESIEEFDAMTELYENQGRCTSADIYRVMMARKGGRPRAIRSQAEWPAPGYNVVNGPRGKQHICSQEHVCPFHTLLRRCNLTQGKCKHAPHKERSAVMCKNTDKAECPHGAFCAFRHPGDEYKIWFYDWKQTVYKMYVWKDYHSSFSSKKR